MQWELSEGAHLIRIAAIQGEYMNTRIRTGRFSIVWIIVGVAVVPLAVLGLFFFAERILRWHFYPGI